MRTRWFATTLLLLLCFSGSALGGTWLQDDQGRAAPPANFLGTGGQQTQVNATDRLPVQTVADTLAAPLGPTTSTTDPMGWGMAWYTGTFAAAATAFTILPVAVSPNLIFGFAQAEVGTTVDFFISEDQGRTWQKKQTLNFAGQTWSVVTFAVHIDVGWWLLGGNCFGGPVTPACTGFGIFNIDGTAAQVALPGLTAGLAGGMATIHQQGTTVMGTWVRGADSTARRCRSTDSGFTWACDAGGGFGTLALTNGKAIDSPGLNIWVRSRTAAIDRSTDDGVTFGTVSVLPPGDTVLECISSTVCLATAGSSIWRSTDAGVTWALAFTAPGGIAPAWSGFVDYTNGIVAAVPSAVTMDMWLSRDSGATWAPTFRLAGNTQRCIAPCQTAAIGGIGLWSAGGAVNAEKVVYSPTIGFGQTQILGATGNSLAVDTTGRVTANQGAGAGYAGAWGAHITDGTTSRLITPYTIGVSPIEGDTLRDARSVSAANAAVTITLTGAANKRAHLYSIAAYCSAGSASVTVLDAAANVWDTPAGTVGTALWTATWTVGKTGTTANNMSVTLGTCGVGNVGTLSVQGDLF